MPMFDASWVLGELRASLRRLASPAAEQVAYLRGLGSVSVDELALELDAVAGTVEGLVAGGMLPAAAAEAVRAVDRQLAAMSGRHQARLWQEEALAEAPEWARVRELAAAALATLPSAPEQR